VNRQPGIIDAEFEEGARPCLAVIEVPVEAIDGTPSVGAVLEVRGKGDGFVVLEIGGKNVRVRADQLEAAMQSLAVLSRTCMLMPQRVPPLSGCVR